MSIDLKRSHCSQRLGRLLAAGTVLQEEGKILCAVLEDGVEKAALVAAPVGTEKVLGFSMLGDAQPAETSAVEELTTPAAGALELDLHNNDLVVGKVRVLDVVAGTTRVVDAVYAGAPPATDVKLDHAAGKIKFNAADAGKLFRITYIYELTLTESKQLFGERFVNNRGLHAEFGQAEIQNGVLELYTDQFDAAQDYSVSPVLTLGANGIITVGGAGPVLPLVVVSVPSADNAYLGVRGIIA